jgi:hypothetical protein
MGAGCLSAGTVTPMLALLDGPSQDLLEEIADEPLPGSLVVLACRIPALASSAAMALGRRMLGSADSRRDVARFAPAGENWLVDEVAEVAARAALMPDTRHFLVLDRAERLDQKVFDRLLRLIEEPPAPLTMVLVVPSLSDVPATLLGRASVAVTLLPADRAGHVTALVDAGATLPAAREAVSLSGTQVQWALPLSVSSALRSKMKALVSPRFEPAAPVADALERLVLASSIAAAVDAAAGQGVGEVPTVRFDEVDAAGKSAARDLLRLFVEHRRTALVSALPRLDGAQLETVAACLSALDRFEERLRRNVTASIALAALAAESPVLRLRPS